ncbi:sporulation protein [Clostridium sp. OF13-4]|nr:sporulation protein [Clostridium sp. OF13-4]
MCCFIWKSAILSGVRHWQEKRESVCISLKSVGCRCFSGGTGNGKGGRSASSFFFLLLLFLAQFVWEIDWSGNRRYTESELNHYLQTLQIEEGIPKKRISCARLEEELRESFEDITWVSVRLHGTRLFIRLRESEVPVRQEVESGEACDLAAASDARITSVVVRSGIPLVQAGDTVEKGQLLVSGTVPITDDGGEEISSYRVRADADIYGIRERVGRKELPLWREMRTETGKKRYGIALEAGTHTFYWKIPEFYDMIEHTFDMAEQWGFFRRSRRMKPAWTIRTEYRKLRLPLDFYLPLSVGWSEYRETSVCEKRYTEPELAALSAAFQKETEEKLIEKGVHIMASDGRILINGGVCHFEVRLQTEEPIQVVTQGEQQRNEHNRDND